MDILLLPNPEKPDAMQAAEQLSRLLQARPKNPDHLQGAPALGRVGLIPGAARAQIVQFKPNLIIVLGGDGSILTTAHAMNGSRVPVVGINFGKLGYLAAYSLEEFIECLEPILAGKVPRTERLMLKGAVYPWHRNGAIQSLADLAKLTPHSWGLALNDVVINAGEPFRMIELEVQIDEERTTTFRSDGLVVATASGSTGYNLSAGGPLISPEVEAMVLAPICPYTLAFRPVVLPADAAILVCPHRLNPGSRVNFDGQVNIPLAEDECLLIRRAPNTLTLIENPRMSHWQMLAEKMHWARSPKH
jgi:NAD+ kinase